MDALRSLEGDDVQNSYGMYGFDGVLNNYYIYVSCSFGLAFLLILVMLFAVCLRDYRAGVRGRERDHSSDDLPLSVITSRASDARNNASISGSRNSKSIRLIRTPRRFSRVLRRRQLQRSSSTSTTRTQLAHSHDIEANAGQPVDNHESVHRDTSSSSLAAPAAAIDTHLAVLAPSVPSEPYPEHPDSGRFVSVSDSALGMRRAMQSTIESQVASTSTPSDFQQNSNQHTSPLDESDVAVVDALEIQHGVAQPPAYIASELRAPPSSSRSFSDRGKARAVSPESPTDHQRWLAHVATDDKSTLSELRSAASAPVPNLRAIASNVSYDLPNSISEENHTPSAPIMDSRSMPVSAPSLASAPIPDRIPVDPTVSSNDGNLPIADHSQLMRPTALDDIQTTNAYALPSGRNYIDPLASNEPFSDALRDRVDILPDSASTYRSASIKGGRQNGTDRMDTTATSAVHHQKQAEADAEIAHLRTLLPSVPTEYGLQSESLPIYGVTPSAPADVFGTAHEPLDLEQCDSHIVPDVNESTSETRTDMDPNGMRLSYAEETLDDNASR
ncbi:hypothetical protein MYAM1_003272 [Malassezia yamatoensis]|uniref:Uncharacterized protein n=1 Tax=Malassezia yamatoensis TaxID=253288 RepID=A0AAJ5YZR1_9BASI|nr:hypothetical protein MYAM1_003272 [Malassezia yamatoensis]